MVYVLVSKSKSISKDVPHQIQLLLEEFSYVFSKDLPERLLLLRDIQHQIDLILEVALPNKAHYSMSSIKYEKLRRQVN